MDPNQNSLWPIRTMKPLLNVLLQTIQSLGILNTENLACQSSIVWQDMQENGVVVQNLFAQFKGIRVYHRIHEHYAHATYAGRHAESEQSLVEMAHADIYHAARIDHDKAKNLVQPHCLLGDNGVQAPWHTAETSGSYSGKAATEGGRCMRYIAAMWPRKE